MDNFSLSSSPLRTAYSCAPCTALYPHPSYYNGERVDLYPESIDRNSNDVTLMINIVFGDDVNKQNIEKVGENGVKRMQNFHQNSNPKNKFKTNQIISSFR